MSSGGFRSKSLSTEAKIIIEVLPFRLYSFLFESLLDYEMFFTFMEINIRPYLING